MSKTLQVVLNYQKTLTPTVNNEDDDNSCRQCTKGATKLIHPKPAAYQTAKTQGNYQPW